jgi:hypothetical protein
VRPVVVLAEAAEDIEAAREFYDSVEVGLGNYFADSIITDLESLALFHGVHAKHFRFHRMLASRFPFGIYYEDSNEETRIFGVLDLRGDPSRIRTALSGR